MPEPRQKDPILPSDPLIIACDWIPPSFGAVGQYELARAREVAKAGRVVMLIGLGINPGDELLPVGDGRLRIVRIAADAPDKGNFLRRALWALSMNARLLKATRDAARGLATCEIKVTGSPPFFSYVLLLWRQLFWRTNKGARSITYRITDFYPETAFAAGKAKAIRPLAPLIHALRRRADRIEALSECQARRLEESGVDRQAISIVRDASPVALSPNTPPGPRPFCAGEFVLLYSGNLGVAHDWRTFADAYRRHIQSGANRVRLWLNATGVGAPALKAYCETHRLPIHTSPPAPLNELAGVLMAADAHLILLGDPFWGYVFPSKTYACLDTGRPCLYVGPEQSDVHLMLGASDSHFSARQGDVEAVFNALESLAAAPIDYQGTDPHSVEGKGSNLAPPLRGP
jgi:hypothetical protein